MSIVRTRRLWCMASVDPIVVVPYDEAWPSLFEEERDRIERAIGPWVEEIEHVGSTAVPGLAAKPVIDIMVGVKSLADSPIIVERLVGIGYEYVPEFEQTLPFRRYFRKMREGRRTHQIHLVEDRTPSGGIGICSFVTTCGRIPKLQANTPISSTSFRTALAKIGRRTRTPRQSSSRRSFVGRRRTSEANCRGGRSPAPLYQFSFEALRVYRHRKALWCSRSGWLPRWRAPAVTIGSFAEYPGSRKEAPDENQ